MERSDKIFIAGHRGLVGSALLRRCRADGYANIVTRSRAELDLRDATAVTNFFAQERPAVVLLAAAKVGGIGANSAQPVEFLLWNLQIQNNVISAAHQVGVRKLLFLGSSCIYPKHAAQPIREDALLTGPLEPTNESYAIAKIAGLRLCQAYAREYGANFISAMPSNLYGPGDNFDLAASHVLPAFIRRAHEAKTTRAAQLVLWGTGRPLREFLHVDDAADACLFLLDHYDSPEVINIGGGEEVSIRVLAEMVCDIVGYEGQLVWDDSKPDGTPRKIVDASRLRALGWEPTIPLREGIRATYDWFVANVADKMVAPL